MTTSLTWKCSPRLKANQSDMVDKEAKVSKKEKARDHLEQTSKSPTVSKLLSTKYEKVGKCLNYLRNNR